MYNLICETYLGMIILYECKKFNKNLFKSFRYLIYKNKIGNLYLSTQYKFKIFEWLFIL